MGHDLLTGRKPGLSRRSGLGDLMRARAPRCTRTAELECHHVIRDLGSGIENAQMLCKPCHEATESHSAPGLSPLPFSEAVKAAARAASGGRCQCTKAHLNHGYPVPLVPLR